jgi:hypothetical protein
MAKEIHHEVPRLLSGDTLDMHRALVSLTEELEAIDLYQQRADACADPQLRTVFLHNKNEEIEHASMLMEWIRLHDAHFGATMKTHLFTEAPITRTGSGAAAVAPGAMPAAALLGKQTW